MRIRIRFSSPFIFSTEIAVRVSDINYGGHVGNDSILSIIHEARLRMLTQWQFTELNAGGCGLIMADSAIQYKAEAFYGDQLIVRISVENISDISFDLFYKIVAVRNENEIDIAYAKTGLIAFDYKTRKICNLPDILCDKLRPQ